MPDIPMRQLGRTGLDVTMLSYGAMELRGVPRGRDVSDDDADSILNAALDLGINFIDTSVDYGISEERIGRFISKRRSEYYLATKCGCLFGLPREQQGRGSKHDYSRENIVKAFEQSLTRLQTDYVDLLQVHMSPSVQVLEENGVLDVMREFQRDGKVRFIGMSGILPNITDHIAMGVFDTFQIPYSALDREHEDAITQASQAGAGIIIRGGAAKGGPSEEKEEGTPWNVWQQANLDGLLDGMSRMEFVLRFTFTHPDMDTTIVGTISPDHMRDNLEALKKGPLPQDLYEEAKQRLNAVGSAPMVKVG
jgi:aryl-alcohol dehydrogenase-like predicted oxidoreductase